MMNVRTDVHEDPALAEMIKNLALEDYKGPGHPQYAGKERLEWLKERGSQVWLDTGDASAAEAVWSPEVEALTTNNTLVNQVVQTGSMDGLISYAAREIRKARPDISDRDLVIEIAFLVNARLALSLVEKFNAHVSVELHSDLGYDIRGILTFAKRYYDIRPDHFYVKVPLTSDGFVATRMLSQNGIPVNYTLGFSARQNYLATCFSHPRFVNVFLGRLNQLVEENHLGKPENVGEKAALASFEAVRDLRKSHIGTFTQQIAASMRSGRQVAMMAGVDVLTIPPKAAEEYLSMPLSKHEVGGHTSDALAVELDFDKAVEAGELTRLWEIDGKFMAFVEDAVKQADQIASGEQLVKLSHRHDVGLFYDWTSEDRARLRAKGKIPVVSEWPGVPIDDLMSMSALESFSKDQLALDSRIAELMNG